MRASRNICRNCQLDTPWTKLEQNTNNCSRINKLSVKKGVNRCLLWSSGKQETFQVVMIISECVPAHCHPFQTHSLRNSHSFQYFIWTRCCLTHLSGETDGSPSPPVVCSSLILSLSHLQRLCSFSLPYFFGYLSVVLLRGVVLFRHYSNVPVVLKWSRGQVCCVNTHICLTSKTSTQVVMSSRVKIKCQ